MMGFGVRQTWVQIPALLLISFVYLGKLLKIAFLLGFLSVKWHFCKDLENKTQFSAWHIVGTRQTVPVVNRMPEAESYFIHTS